jgi:hypothetical protein
VTARKSRQARGRKLASRLILVCLVVLAVAGLYGVAGLSRPMTLSSGSNAAAAGRLPVVSALLGCPAPGSAGLTGGSIAQASAPATNGPGHVTVTELNPPAGARSATTALTSAQPGQLAIKTVKNAPVVPVKALTLPSMAGGLVPTSKGRGGVILSATGADSQGLDVEQLGPGGQPAARCQPPGASFWFVGPGGSALHTDLYLMNTDSQPADAQVSVQTDSGPLFGKADSGISVPPHSMVVQSLDKLLHSAKAVSLHVTTSIGRVVAAVRETTSKAKPGIWLPPALQPSTTQVLPGLPAGAGTRELYVTVPGNGAARVKITAVTPRGSYQPTGGSGISLLGRQTTGVSLPSLSGFPGSIKISADVPVTAALEVSGGPSGAPGAFVVGSDPVTEQGVVAASPVGSAGTTYLVLSAPGKAATVKVEQAIAGAPLTGQPGKVVTINAKSATMVKITLPKHSLRTTLIGLVLTPEPGSGPVYAARLAMAAGSVVQVLPVGSSPASIELPSVQASLVSVLGS